MFKAISKFRSYSTQIFRNKIESQSKAINKILIANRGEIACRVIRTAKRLGIRTTAVYSDIDENSLHTVSADEAYCIGPAPTQQSYLCGDKIIEIAKRAGCEAIHPGYGFLSENAEFAEFCEKEGIVFIGPPAAAIRDMGIKSTSKQIMTNAGVPVINGYHGDDQSDARLISEANKIGFPLMIKAVRGGGGKGMRIAEKSEDFLNALNSARTESEKAFGDGSVLLERYVRSPRHVEVQVFADHYGNCVYLYERDCSVQRRHQKIIEEAPAPGLSKELRQRLGETAVKAAQAVGYVGAGTVEFILDKEDLSFHFMEMNTRLQVEHPITEMITGTDLVEWQIRVASGETLPLTQEQIKLKGHAFEARIYAENPSDGFLPGAGPLKHLTAPAQNPHVRIETGVRQGDEVSVHYDPMIAKLVVWGENRSQALNSLVARLRDYHVTGLETNINFLINLALHPEFRAGNVHTGFIQNHYQSLFPFTKVPDCTICEAAIAVVLNDLHQAKLYSKSRSDPFVLNAGFRVNHELVQEIKLNVNDQDQKINVKYCRDGNFEVQINDGKWKSVKAATVMDNDGCLNLRCNIDGAISNVNVVIDDESVTLFGVNGKTKFDFIKPKFLTEQTTGSTAGGSNESCVIVAPMPGVLEKLLVNPGDHVKQGDSLAVIIAMKMEYVLRAPKDSVIKSIEAKTGENIAKGATVIIFEEESEWDLRED